MEQRNMEASNECSPSGCYEGAWLDEGWCLWRVCLGMPVGCCWVAYALYGGLSHGDFGERYTVLSVPSNLDFGLHGKASKDGLVCVSFEGAERALVVPSRPLGWKAGFSWTESSTRLSIRIYWLGNGDRTGEGLCARRVFQVEHRTFDMSARDERRMWITCRWLNPSIN
jgi:hypothetical protein